MTQAEKAKSIIAGLRDREIRLRYESFRLHAESLEVLDFALEHFLSMIPEKGGGEAA